MQKGRTDVLSDPVRLDHLLNIRYERVSAALLPNGSIACASEADAALDSLEEDRGGLVLVHSHRQRIHDFEDHARAFGAHLAERPQSPLLRRASLLLINNNAAELYKRASFGSKVKHGSTAEDPIGWLRAYGNVPWRIRLLITTSLNVGYFCGELHALAALSPITSRFPWVLAFSGPDALPTPIGLRYLDHHVKQTMSEYTFFHDHFPAPRNHLRVSMDIFLYKSSSASHLFEAAAGVCLREVNRIPEVIVAEVVLAQNLTHKSISDHKAWTTWQTKLSRTRPPNHAVVWHVHNESARRRWIEHEERRVGTTYEEQLRRHLPSACKGTLKCALYHGHVCFRSASVRPVGR